MKIYTVNFSHPIEIAIPLDFNGQQPCVHNTENATVRTNEDGSFIGDTTRGGSCNWKQYMLSPHSNGTHTECIGHISQEPISIHHTLKSLLIPTTLITVIPEMASETTETYFPSSKAHDLVITRKALKLLLKGKSHLFCQGLAIRTLPNPVSKLSYDYRTVTSPYFTHEAMHYLLTLQVKHLLVDFPSIDCMYDEGHLSNHRLFWNIALGNNHLTADAEIHKTITELIYVAPEVTDGIYALNLQTPYFVTDAAPSRPILYSLKCRG